MSQIISLIQLGNNWGFHTCNCHYEEDGCVDEDVYFNTCNCDANLPVQMQDTGTITNTSALPVTKMYFGGLEYEIQSGSFLLGRLKCYGEKTIEAGTSCSSLKKSGVFKSGHYAIKPTNAEKQMIVKCDMNSDTYDDVKQSEETDLTDLTAVAPLGSILPWVPKLDPSSGSPLPLPEGWMFCNGSDITKGIWSGGKTPDLNGPGLFLRGGSEDEVLMTQESSIQDHEHQDDQHSHGCSANSVADPHTHQYWHPRDSNDRFQYGSLTARDTVINDQTGSETVTVHTTCEVNSQSSNIGGVTGANADEETRPANMRVLYIIRVF